MDTLRIEGGGRAADLYPWLSAKARGTEALAGILGFGIPGVENYWFQGAGSGSTWRGSRVGNRVINIPLKVYADSRADLNELLSDLSVILDPFTTLLEDGAARLFFGMPDDYEWYVDVVRNGEMDWPRKQDSDDRTYFKTKLPLEAGDPFWTRNYPERFEVRANADTPSLLPRFARLRVGSTAAFGSKEVSNSGDTFAWPVITVDGPTDHILLVGANGEVVEWEGSHTTGHTLTFDMANNTVVDETGANRYDGLTAAPEFWSIAPGDSVVSVQADNSTVDTLVKAQWWPRRWAVV